MVNKLLKIDAIKLPITILNHHPRQIADIMMISSSPLKTLSFDGLKMDFSDKTTAMTVSPDLTVTVKVLCLTTTCLVRTVGLKIDNQKF